MTGEASVRVADIFARPIELIDPDPENSRDIDSPVARADIEEIALSILKRGFDADRALLVRKMPSGRWMVTDGHKRREAVLRAIELGAMIRGVPCRSEPQGTSTEDRAIFRLRAPGRELSPLEAAVARAIQHATARGKTRATGQDVRAVTEKPRTEPPSLASYAVAVVLAWEGGDTAELDTALDNLAKRIGAATLDAARGKLAA